jgi:TRAP-type C4-dicarboxylate transport system substrate-binding protein
MVMYRGFRIRSAFAASLMSLLVAGASLAPSATPTIAQDSVRWRLNGDQAVNFWWNPELTTFVEEIKTNTNGTLDIEFFPASSLGITPQGILAPLRSGTVEMAEFVASYVAGEAPILTLLGLPMIAGTVDAGYEKAKRTLPEVSAMMNDRYGVKVLASLSSTPLQLFLGKIKYTGVDSLKGLRIRTLGQDQEAFISSLGAIPVTVPLAEIATALSTNRIDAVIAGSQYLVAQNFKEFGPNIVAWNAMLAPGYVAVNNAKWRSLTPEQQAVVEKAAANLQGRIWAKAASLEAEVQASAEGYNFIELSAADRSVMTDKASDAWAKWVKRGGEKAANLLNTANGQ